MRGAREQLHERSLSGSQRASGHSGEVPASQPPLPLQPARNEHANARVSDDVSPEGSVRELQQRAGNQALLGLLSAGVIQRKAKDSESGSAPAESTAERAPVSTGPSLIVEDDTRELQPGQMRQSEFLSQLRTAVCRTAEQALAGTMWSAMGCPYIERWLGHYSKQPSAYLERALRKYAPETASARSAHDYIPLVTQRVRRGIEEWRTTGEVKDLPEEFATSGMPGATVSGLVGGLLSGVGSAISGLVSGAGRAIGGAISSVGSMLFKHREGSEGSESATEQDPAAIRAQLGSGQSLDGAVQRRMQSAFGVDFAGVRVHTDARARELSEGLQARAFTIGNDIAFGAEEYQPGTPVGDALIAHELAHVVQQGTGDNAATTAQHKGGTASGALEEDANRSAVGAVMKLWTGARGELTQLGHSATPRLRSGLRLQGCGGPAKETKATTGAGAAGKPIAPAEWAKNVKAATDNKDAAMMLALVKQALEPKYTVDVAGTSSPDKEDPKDYKKTPVINFDPNLNGKKKHGSDDIVSEKNGGHSFDVGNDTYAIIGPKALDRSSPLATVMWAEHELYHTTHHLGAAKPRPQPGEKPLTKAEKAEKDASEELETYTNDFVHYFHFLASINSGPDGNPMYFGDNWNRVLNNYAKARAAAKTAALQKLGDYYQNPPTSITEGVSHHPTNAAEVKQAFELWLQRRDQSAELVRDLKAKLKL